MCSSNAFLILHQDCLNNLYGHLYFIKLSFGTFTRNQPQYLHLIVGIFNAIYRQDLIMNLT